MPFRRDTIDALQVWFHTHREVVAIRTIYSPFHRQLLI